MRMRMVLITAAVSATLMGALGASATPPPGVCVVHNGSPTCAGGPTTVTVNVRSGQQTSVGLVVNPLGWWVGDTGFRTETQGTIVRVTVFFGGSIATPIRPTFTVHANSASPTQVGISEQTPQGPACLVGTCW